MTDDARVYWSIGREFANHGTTLHSNREFAKPRRRSQQQSAENFFSILKRGVIGTYHHWSPAHMHRYLGRVRLSLFDQERCSDRRKSAPTHAARHRRQAPDLSADCCARRLAMLMLIASAENIALEKTYSRYGKLDMLDRIKMTIGLAVEARWPGGLIGRLKSIQRTLQKGGDGLAEKRNMFVHGVHAATDTPGEVALTMVRWPKNKRQQIVTLADAYLVANRLDQLVKEAQSIDGAYGAWKFKIKHETDGRQQIAQAKANARLVHAHNVKRAVKLLLHAALLCCTPTNAAAPCLNRSSIAQSESHASSPATGSLLSSSRELMIRAAHEMSSSGNQMPINRDFVDRHPRLMPGVPELLVRGVEPLSAWIFPHRHMAAILALVSRDLGTAAVVSPISVLVIEQGREIDFRIARHPVESADQHQPTGAAHFVAGGPFAVEHPEQRCSSLHPVIAVVERRSLHLGPTSPLFR
jgi:hypothetical protein